MMKKFLFFFASAIVLMACNNNDPEVDQPINKEVEPGQEITIAVSTPTVANSSQSPIRKIYGNMTSDQGIAFTWESGDQTIEVTSLNSDGTPAQGAQYTSTFTMDTYVSGNPRKFHGTVPEIPEGGPTDRFLISCGPKTVPTQQTKASGKSIDTNMMRFEAFSALTEENILLKPVWSIVNLQSNYVYNCSRVVDRSYYRDHMSLILRVSQVKLTEYIYTSGSAPQEERLNETIEMVWKKSNGYDFSFESTTTETLAQPTYAFVVKPAKDYSFKVELTYTYAGGTGYNGEAEEKTDEIVYAPKRQIVGAPHEEIVGVHTMTTMELTTAPLDSAIAQNMQLAEEMITWVPAEEWNK